MMDNQNQSYIIVTAMVLQSSPIGEYDRRVVLLTKERGKISAFARGAGRPRSSLVASTNVFAFGTFRLLIRRSSFTLTEAKIQNYFSYFLTHLEASLLGQYFCEVLEYCTRENNDEAQLLLLLYQSLRALESERFSLRLVRAVFELKTVDLEGELREPDPASLLPATMAAFAHIRESSIGKLYSFTIDEAPMAQLSRLASAQMDRAFERHRFQSLEILNAMLL